MPAGRQGLWAAAGLAVLLAGCGGGSAGQEALDGACREGSGALARIGPVVRLADAAPALRMSITVERAALHAVRSTAGGNDPLAVRLREAIAVAERALASVERTDPLRLGTMSPLRTAVPAARRALAEARALVHEVCRGQ